MLQASMTPCPLGAAKGGYFRKMPSDFYPHPECHLGEVEEITPPTTSPHPCNNAVLWGLVHKQKLLHVCRKHVENFQEISLQFQVISQGVFGIPRLLQDNI